MTRGDRVTEIIGTALFWSLMVLAVVLIVGNVLAYIP